MVTADSLTLSFVLIAAAVAQEQRYTCNHFVVISGHYIYYVRQLLQRTQTIMSIKTVYIPLSSLL